MPITPEDRARQNIDRLLTDSGWVVQDKRATNLSAAKGVAVREFPLKPGHGEADYLLFVDAAPMGVIEAKREGVTLTGVELQTTKYSEGIPDNLPALRRPLPFQYQSTGVETRFTKPIAANPALRNHLVEIRKSYEQTIDTVTRDELISAGLDPAARERAQSIVKSFEEFIEQHKDEITALQILYSRPYKQRLTFKEIKELAETIERPPRAWTPDRLWHAYEALDRSKVRGSGGRVLTDIVSLVRFATHQQDELRPFQVDVSNRFARWVSQQESNGRKFTDEQRQWLEAIRDHVAASLTIESEDFEYEPFVQRGGLGKAYQVFGKDLEPILKELNEVLVQ